MNRLQFKKFMFTYQPHIDYTNIPDRIIGCLVDDEVAVRLCSVTKNQRGTDACKQ